MLKLFSPWVSPQTFGQWAKSSLSSRPRCQVLSFVLQKGLGRGSGDPSGSLKIPLCTGKFPRLWGCEAQPGAPSAAHRWAADSSGSPRQRWNCFQLQELQPHPGPRSFGCLGFLAAGPGSSSGAVRVPRAAGSEGTRAVNPSNNNLMTFQVISSMKAIVWFLLSYHFIMFPDCLHSCLSCLQTLLKKIIHIHSPENGLCSTF